MKVFTRSRGKTKRKMEPNELEQTTEVSHEESSPKNLQQQVANWKNQDSFLKRWFGNAVKFGVELSMFFTMLSLVAVPLAIVMPEATLSLKLQAATPWHVVVPFSLSLTGAAWCWSV